MQQNRKVKLMKKKISLILGMCLIMLSLTACGEDPKKVDYNGYTYNQLEEELQNMAGALTAMSDEEMEQYKKEEGQQYELLVNVITRWQEATDDIGAYKELGEFSITKSGKTLTCEQEVIYEERPVILTYVFTYYNMELNDITVDPVQTLGEKMANAGLNTVMGMGVVFAVLILISLIIYAFKIFPYLEQRKKAKKAEIIPEAEEKVQEVQVAEQDDLELVAVIAAAIAATTGTSTDDFVVRSIKRRF